MRKIMFNDKYGLTEAVLGGLKTMTRRLIPQSILNKAEEYQQLYYNKTLDRISFEDALVCMIDDDFVKYGYKVGEIVAVAQPYCKFHIISPTKEEVLNGEEICYFSTSAPAWTNKMFVRADMMPHQILITDINVERLQDISDEDCLKEGIYEDWTDGGWSSYEFYDYENSFDDGYDTPREAFASLIDKISGKNTWDSNPYVFAYSFKLVK